MVVTPSLPQRTLFRAECVQSVWEQRLQPVAHLIHLDYAHAGPARALNALLPAAKATGAEWVAQLADDDLMLPSHLQTLVDHATDADIVYSYCRVEGRVWDPNALFDADRLRRENYIPATTLIRTSLCVELGWRADSEHGFEDWDFWLRALERGARFVCVPEVTWVYRFHGANMSYATG